MISIRKACLAPCKVALLPLQCAPSTLRNLQVHLWTFKHLLAHNAFSPNSMQECIIGEISLARAGEHIRNPNTKAAAAACMLVVRHCLSLPLMSMPAYVWICR